MPRSVTVTFADGTSHVYENVPDDATPNQVEARAQRDFPGQPISQIMGGDIMLRDIRNAIASREASMDDLRAIAQRYGREIPDEDVAQQWLYYAVDHPTIEIPSDVVTPPVGRFEAMSEGAMRGLQNVADVVTRFAGRLVDRFGLSP